MCEHLEATQEPEQLESFLMMFLRWSRISLLYFMSSSSLEPDLSLCLPLCHCLTPPPHLPIVYLLPPSCILSSQWLHPVLATSPLRGFLCSLGCQVNFGMSGSFNTKEGWGGALGWAWVLNLPGGFKNVLPVALDVW